MRLEKTKAGLNLQYLGLRGAQVGLLIHCRVGKVLQGRIVDQLRDFKLLQLQLNIRGHAGLQVANSA